MSEAVTGLIGVVIGGTLTGVVTFVLERRRERRAEMSALRLLELDLRDAGGKIEAVVDRGEWWHRSNLELPTAAWRDHRYLLASRLDHGDWQEIAEAFHAMIQLNAHVARAAAAGEPLSTDAEMCERLKLYLREIDEAVACLRAHTGRPARPAEPPPARARPRPA